MKTLGIASALLLLSACNNPPPVVSVPPAEWTAPVAEPTVPVLPENATQEQVDEAAADYIARLWDAFQAAQNKLKRLDEWRAKVSE